MILSVNSNIEHKLEFICKKLSYDHREFIPGLIKQYITDFESTYGEITDKKTRRITSVPFTMFTCFKKHYQTYFKQEYMPMGSKEIELRHMKLIQNKIVQQAANQTEQEILSVRDEDIITAFDLFLQTIPEWWVKNNFTPKSIASNFEKILSQIKNDKFGKQPRKHSLEDFLGGFAAQGR